MVKQPVYLLIFWLPSPRLELRTMAGYSQQLIEKQKLWRLKRMPDGTFLNAVIQLLK